jgi:type IV secretion system protein VirD4
MLCFGTAIDAERFCTEKSAIFIVLPEEDTSKYFMVSLLIQQLYREILAVADENGGALPRRVMLFLDELGTLPKIEGIESMFSQDAPEKSPSWQLSSPLHSWNRTTENRVRRSSRTTRS